MDTVFYLEEVAKGKYRPLAESYKNNMGEEPSEDMAKFLMFWQGLLDHSYLAGYNDGLEIGRTTTRAKMVPAVSGIIDEMFTRKKVSTRV